METVEDFIFLGSKITADSQEIRRLLVLGRKAMTNLDSILKSRDITLPANVHLVKTLVFPVVIYGCESWTLKKTQCQRIDAFELPPASPVGSPSSASGYDSGFFQITASTLHLSSCESFCEHFRNGELSDFSECKPCWPSKPDILGTHPASAGTPDFRSPMRGPISYSLWKLCGYFPICGSLLGIWVLILPHLCPSFLYSLWILF